MKLFIPIVNLSSKHATSAIRQKMLTTSIKSFEVEPINIAPKNGFINKILILINLVYWASRQKKITIIYISGSPFWLFFIAYATIFNQQAKIFIEYRDPWSGDVMRTDTNLRRKLVRFAERTVLSAATGVFVISKEIQDAIPVSSKHKHKIRLTSTEVDATRILKLTKRNRSNNKDILHLGNVDRLMSVTSVANYVNAHPEQVFRFIGTWDDDALKSFKSHCTNPTAYIENRINHDEAVAKMTEASALLLMGSVTSQRLHRKTFEYMLMLKPILYFGCNDSPTFRLLNEFCQRLDHKDHYTFKPMADTKVTQFCKKYDKHVIVGEIELEIQKMSRL